MKRKHKMIKIVLTASVSVMMFGVPGFAAAGEPAFSEALYANPPPLSMSDRNATSYSLIANPIHNRNVENREISPDLLPAEKLMLPLDELSQIEYAPAKMIGPQSIAKPVEAYNRTGASQPFLGLGWDRDAGNRNRWNLVFGLGFYISNYQGWNHPADDFGLEAPVPDREQGDLFEKIQNALQVVGFQIRYDF